MRHSRGWQTAADFAPATRMNELAERMGFAVLSPDGDVCRQPENNALKTGASPDLTGADSYCFGSAWKAARAIRRARPLPTPIDVFVIHDADPFPLSLSK